MAYKFTSEQQAAIDTRDRTLLVSAAAGSGKTATLTERIIRSLTDPTHPTSLSRLVVATFTNDSAADMRKKIASALDAALAREPENTRLAKEQLLMSSARISTIDSFCVRLLRRYAEELGLSPSFRVAEPAENELLAAEVMDELLEALFGGECEGITAEEFCFLTELLTSAKGEDDLPAHLLSLYEDVLCEVRGVETLHDAALRYAAEADKPFLSTVYGGEVADRYAKIFSDIASAFTSSLDRLEGTKGDSSLAKRIPFCRTEAEQLTSLAAALRARNRAAAEAVTAFGSIPAVSKSASDENRALSTLHTEAREALAELRTRYLSYTEAELSVLLRRLSAAAELLYRILSLYDARLTAEKRRRGLLGFSDIERYACALLSQNGEPTPLARELADGIDYIYIDEFQDVNALQYTIFRSISRGDNLFMVGDVKQCIYAFRHADPSIFSGLRAAYPPVGDTYAPTGTLFFSRNFRCDGPIVRYVNRVAGGLLRAVSGGGYTVADELVLSKPEPRGEEPVHTHIFELPTRKASAAEEEGDEDLTVRECLFVAEEIARLLREGRKNDGSPIRPSDITLLFRTTGRMPQFAAALAGVAPVVVSAERDFFLNPEVLLALSLLYVIDNPRRDIYLAAALRSPVFDLTLGELCAVRAHGRSLPTLYDALLAYCEANPDFEKGKRFLSQLADWRRLAEGETVGSLVLTVLGDAGLLSLAGEGATPHHDNLYRLYQYARSFEASSYEGLYSFISYVNTAIENGATILKPAAEGKADAVRFMTVHGSKGLEFPVVFLCDTQHPFNLSDTRAPLLYDREYGPVLRFPNNGGTALAESPIRSLVASRLRHTAAEEEIRLLYVALTRARERLYVTGAATKLDEKLSDAHKEADLFLDWKILSRTSCLAWILPLLAESGDPYLRLHYLEEGASEPEAAAALQEESETVFAAHPDFAEELYRRLTFAYPDEAATRLPEKLSVSRLSPSVLDGSEEEAAPIALPEEHRPTVPVFLSGKHADEAALAGTATHLFMQFCDLAHLTPEGVEAEIARLVAAEFIRPEDAARVRRDEVAAFCRSALFARLRAAKRVRRELRFHALLPAEAFTAEEARAAALAGRELLVQGVIDCILEEEDGYTVIDYKTDRLTPAELADPRLAAEKLTKRHGDQLAYYAAACTRMLGKPPREVLLYSLPLGDTVRVECPPTV